jgi:hypothetical protein
MVNISIRISGLSLCDEFQLNVLLQYLENSIFKVLIVKCRWEARNWISKVKDGSKSRLFQKAQMAISHLMFIIRVGYRASRQHLVCSQLQVVIIRPVEICTLTVTFRDQSKTGQGVSMPDIKFKYVKLQANWPFVGKSGNSQSVLWIWSDMLEKHIAVK